MANAKTVHELFALRKQAKTPEEKRAIGYAIDQAAQAMKRKPSPTDVRFVEQTKEYFEHKEAHPELYNGKLPPKPEKVTVKPSPFIGIRTEAITEKQKGILPDIKHYYPGMKPGYVYGTGIGEPLKPPTKLDIAEQKTHIRAIKEDVPSHKIESVYKEEIGKVGYTLIEEKGKKYIISKKELKRQEDIEREQEAIRKRMTGTPIERVSEIGRFVSGVFIKPQEFISVTGEALFGKREGISERLLKIRAAQSLEFKGKKPWELFEKSYEPGGFGFMMTTTAVASAGMGAGMGALKSIAWGKKPLLISRGIWETAKHPILKTVLKVSPVASKPIWTLTRAKAIELGIVGYGTYETGKAFAKEPIFTSAYLAMTLPYAIPMYKIGHRWGMGFVERKYAMATLKTPIERVRQQAIIESIERVYKLKEPRFDVKPYDISQIKHVDTSTSIKFTSYYKTEWQRSIFGGRPRIGGSLAVDIPTPPGLFRTGKLPKSVTQWATKRQAISGTIRPLIGKQKPVDIDVFIREFLGARSRIQPIARPHVIDIPEGGYAPGRYYRFGFAELPSTKGKVFDPWLSKLKIHTFSPDIPETAGVAGYTYLPHPSIKGFPLEFTAKGGITATKPHIFISERYLARYPSWWQNKPSKFWAAPEEMRFGGYLRFIPKKFGAMSTLVHEIHHHRFPRLTTGYLGERINVLLEQPAFRQPALTKSLKTFIKTGKWTYKGDPMKVKLVSLREQFMRKGESILPSKIYGRYRSYKDIPDWWEISRMFDDKKLQTITHRVIHPELYVDKAPKITISEKIIGKIGAPPEAPRRIIPLSPTGRTISYLEYPKAPSPSYFTPLYVTGLPTTYKYMPSKKYKAPLILGKYKPILSQIIKPPVAPPYIPTSPRKKIPAIVPPYHPPYKPPAYPPVTPPVIPPSKPPPYTPPHEPTPVIIPPTYKKRVIIPEIADRKPLPIIKQPFGKKYKFRKTVFRDPFKSVVKIKPIIK